MTGSALSTPIGYGPDLYDELDALGFAGVQSLLDVAAGTGAASEPFAHRGVRVTALDATPDPIAAYASRVPNVVAQTGHAHALPFPDNSFDGVVLGRALHEIDPASALAEAVRVTKPGGAVAAFWRELSNDDPLRAVRSAVAAVLGLEPLAEETPAGFTTFYATPFAARTLRVVPYVTRITPRSWVADERASGRALMSYGTERAEAYYAALERALATDGNLERGFVARFVQYVYVGRVG